MRICCLRDEVPPERVVLEYPHPNILGAKIDTVVVGEDHKMRIAAEFKFERGNPSEINHPRTRKAGAVFADFVRLLRLREPVETME